MKNKNKVEADGCATQELKMKPSNSPEGRLPKPYQELKGFAKTKLY